MSPGVEELTREPAAWFYVGKEEDGTGCALDLLLSAAGYEGAPHALILTGRSAVLRTSLGADCSFFKPVIGPAEGVLRGLRIFGAMVRSHCLEGATERRLETFAQLMKQEYDQPVLFGPVDRTRLWNRFDGRSFAAAAHFVLIHRVDRSVATVHDPEGVPYGRFPLGKLFDSLSAGEASVVATLQPGMPRNSRPEIVRDAVRQMAYLRRAYASVAGVSGQGLRALSHSIEKKLPVGSVFMALQAGLGYRGRTAIGLESFMEEAGSPREAGWTLREMAFECARAAKALRDQDAQRTAASIVQIARLEDRLDEILLTSVGIAGGAFARGRT